MQTASEHSPKLTIRREAALKRIAEQRDRGMSISIHGGTEEDFLEAKKHVEIWTEKTRELLKASFTTPEHAIEFDSYYVAYEHPSLGRRAGALKRVVDDQCQFLERLMQELGAN